MSDRYEASGSQAEFQPGSESKVLANKLGITSPEDMDELELVLLEKLYQAVLIDEFPDRGLKVADLKRWHHRWLGNVYPWAGEERSLNMSKGDFHFAAAAQIPRLLEEFEQDCLSRFTPARGLEDDAVPRALAVTHVELILIHPFREGNGRLARLLADVMACQAGYGLMDYSDWDWDKDRYFAAIQHGMSGNYEPMVELVVVALKSGKPAT